MPDLSVTTGQCSSTIQYVAEITGASHLHLWLSVSLYLSLPFSLDMGVSRAHSLLLSRTGPAQSSAVLAKSRAVLRLLVEA